MDSQFELEEHKKVDNQFELEEHKWVRKLLEVVCMLVRKLEHKMEHRLEHRLVQVKNKHLEMEQLIIHVVCEGRI